MTGARVPAGVDTVVMQEVARAAAGRVTLPPGQRKGQNIRRAGEDLRAGTPALLAGRLLRPAELVSIGSAAREGQIYDSNRYTLFGMLTRLGFEVIDIGVVRDDPHTLETTLRDAATRADAIITSGGVSVGEADFTREVMARPPAGLRAYRPA